MKLNIKKNNFKPFILLIVISLLIAFLVPYLYKGQFNIDKKVSLDTFVKTYNSWIYSDVLVDWNKAIATLSWKVVDNGFQKIARDIVILPENDSLKDLWLLEKSGTGLVNTKVEIKDLTSERFWSDMLPTILLFVLFIVVAFFVISRMWGMANNAMSFWKSRARIYDSEKDKVLFADVAWAEEEKVELMEIVDFLKNPKKYKEIWAKIPKWVLLVGPPGTWKTLIARAVAGESWVPFLSISWSEFVEMFVWVWASRVRDLFEQAKKLSPSIIFIDEIDAIGKKRWPWLWGWHDEREQTLNQILTEMDWFDQDTNVIVMAATNRSDVLDKALLRPGRFDRKVTINLPNLEDREKILQVHSKWKPVSKDVDFRIVASQTVWFSWADLGNLINEAAIITARKNLKEITKFIINEAFEKIVMWLTKKSQVMTPEEKKITAYHEVWHALIGKLLPNTDPVHKVSIISRWWALWVTWFLPERDTLLVSKAKYLDELSTLYWWRVAEEVFFWKDNITTWASNDIERATKIARSMVTRFWMEEEIWAENFANDYIEWNHLWAEWASKPFSEKTQELIDMKVKQILANAYAKAREIILANKELHIKISEDLLVKEEINKEEFDAYFA
jgi:cell division protease FtsH